MGPEVWGGIPSYTPSSALVTVASDNGIQIHLKVHPGMFPPVTLTVEANGVPVEDTCTSAMIPCISVRYWDGETFVVQSELFGSGSNLTRRVSLDGEHLVVDSMYTQISGTCASKRTVFERV